MLKLFLYVTSLGLLLLLQVSILPIWSRDWPVPNLLLIFILLLSVLDQDYELYGVPLNNESLLSISLAAGLLLDLSAPSPFFTGFWAIALVLLSLTVRLISHSFLQVGLTYKAIALIIFVVGIVVPIVTKLLTHQGLQFGYVFSALISNLVASLIIVLFIYVRTGTLKLES